mmetsp:Transcript_127445/g.407567  ORF Transcript_127445/g.407567 Transcript_127445/m.407567 type:complete len:223 (-) Transcript_127445:1156-1824(-)
MPQVCSCFPLRMRQKKNIDASPSPRGKGSLHGEMQKYFQRRWTIWKEQCSKKYHVVVLDTCTSSTFEHLISVQSRRAHLGAHETRDQMSLGGLTPYSSEHRRSTTLTHKSRSNVSIADVEALDWADPLHLVGQGLHQDHTDNEAPKSHARGEVALALLTFKRSIGLTRSISSTKDCVKTTPSVVMGMLVLPSMRRTQRTNSMRACPIHCRYGKRLSQCVPML